MKNTTVTCDGCEQDITTTENSEAYRLVLANERIPALSSIVTDMTPFPTGITRSHHFCGWHCLMEWISQVNKEPKVGGVINA